MLSLRTLLRTIGTDGAVANVRTVLEARTREDWLVQGLATRLDEVAAEPTPAAPSAPSVPVAHAAG